MTLTHLQHLQPPNRRRPPAPYTPPNEGVVTQTPLIRHNNSSFTTPRALHSHANDVDNDPLSLFG